jgi:hypothetical protein
MAGDLGLNGPTEGTSLKPFIVWWACGRFVASGATRGSSASAIVNDWQGAPMTRDFGPNRRNMPMHHPRNRRPYRKSPAPRAGAGVKYTASSVEIFKHWLAAINSHDVIVLTRLMATDHLFVTRSRIEYRTRDLWRLIGGETAGLSLRLTGAGPSSVPHRSGRRARAHPASRYARR